MLSIRRRAVRTAAQWRRRRKYKLDFLQNPQLPTVDVYATAPTTSEAIALANGAVTGFSTYITHLEQSSAISGGKRIEIRQLGGATGGSVDPSASKKIAVLIFFMVFALWCAVLLFVTNLRRHLRLAKQSGAAAPGSPHATAEHDVSVPAEHDVSVPYPAATQDLDTHSPLANFAPRSALLDIEAQSHSNVSEDTHAGNGEVDLNGKDAVRRQSGSGTEGRAMTRAALRTAEGAVTDLAQADDWPHTKRAMPWMLAGFLVMVFVVPFDGIIFKVHLPFDAKPDRLLIASMVGVAMMKASSNVRARAAAHRRSSALC